MPPPEEHRFDHIHGGYILCDSNLGIYFRPDVGNKVSIQRSPRSLVTCLTTFAYICIYKVSLWIWVQYLTICGIKSTNQILIGGSEPPCDPLHYVENADELDTDFSEEWTHNVYRANLRFPSLGVPAGSQQKGIVSAYDVTEDWVPIYDKTQLGGYFMCVGTSGNQFKNAAPVGKMMAQLIDEVSAGKDHDNDPVVFNLAKSGLGDINMRLFSRKRSIQSTSNTVMG